MRLLSGITETNCSLIIATHNMSLIQKFPARTIRCENGEVAEDKVLSGAFSNA
jgi:ABC-type ATPase involved in cell division